MKFSSFIVLTAAGLAVALPVTPTPSTLLAEKQLTVEPSEAVAKRQVPAGLPLDAVTSGLPVAKRQLDGLLGSDDSEETDSSEPKEPKEPKELKEPIDPTVDGKTTVENDTLVQDTGNLKRQLGGAGLADLLGGDKKEDKKPAAKPANATEPAEAHASKSAAPAPTGSKAAAPAEKKEKSSGLAGLLKRQLPSLGGDKDAAADEEESTDLVNPKQLIPIKRQLGSLLGDKKDASEEDAAATGEEEESAAPADDSKTTEKTPAKDDSEAAEPATEEEADSGLAGILKRQLDALLGKDKDEEETPAEEPATDDAAATEEEPAKDDAATEEEPAKDDAAAAEEPAAEEPAPPAKDESLLGKLGMTSTSQAAKAAEAEAAA